jgi:aspartokinase-like uncharacterized kinase
MADLPSRLRTWLDSEAADQDHTHLVLLVGGGKLVDAVREFDAGTTLGDEPAHWFCVELLDMTGRLLGAMLPELVVVDDFATLNSRLHRPGVTLFCPSQFLKHVEPNRDGTPLASDWSVTSDSIAGRLAVVLAADELVFLKSAPPPEPSKQSDWLGRLASVGYVDAYLTRLAPELPSMSFVHFR